MRIYFNAMIINNGQLNKEALFLEIFFQYLYRK